MDDKIVGDFAELFKYLNNTPDLNTEIRQRLREIQSYLESKENILCALRILHGTRTDEEMERAAIAASLKFQEIEQTLLNEQGKGEPPSPNWEWHGAYWHKHKNIIVSLYPQGDVVRWETVVDGQALDELAETARAAMRAAYLKLEREEG
jgi:hypothetical protein